MPDDMYLPTLITLGPKRWPHQLVENLGLHIYQPWEHLGVRDTKLKPFIFRLRLPDSIVAAISLEELFVNHNRQQFQNTRERTEPPLSTSYFSGTYVQPFLHSLTLHIIAS